jgi:hypothetical protein
MALALKDSHIVFMVPNSSGKKLNPYVGAFSGFVVIGTLEGFSFSKNSLEISIDNLRELRLEIHNLISFFTSNKNKESEISCLGDFFGKVKLKTRSKQFSTTKKDRFLFTINIKELFSITKCRWKVPFFLFKDFEILFFQSLLKDCLNDLSIESLQANENALALYVTNLVSQNENQSSIYNKVALKSLLAHYIEELRECLCNS